MEIPRAVLGRPARQLRRAAARADRPKLGDAVVLMYHRVAALEHDPWRMAVDPGRFAEHVELLHDRFKPMRLGDLVIGLRSGGVPRRSVAVTFDDGYRDNLTAARPLLERHGVPATVFVISGYVGSPRDFWWDELDRLCRGPAAAAAGLVYRENWERLRPLPLNERLAELDALWEAVGGRPPSETSTLTAAEVVELARGGVVEIGAHTATHAVLPSLRRSEQLDEIRSSKVALEEILGRPVRTFSYPHGEYDAVSASCAREAGFACGCTTRGGAATRRTAPYRLPRLHVEDWRAGELEARLEALLRD
jgi:peptidoglycan/xylan/chitin deacetylase (PgdA/CDA1 family)